MNKKDENLTGADVVVDTLINHGVEYVFTVPGAKIDKILDVFNDKPNAPKLIVTHHEQNAAFMAQAIGRLTDKPGVVLVTSGPGVSNLATGLVTATNEGDAVLAIGGNVKRNDSLKRTHQSMDNVGLLKPVTKYSKEIISVDSLSEGISNAYRASLQSRKGATFVSIPQDISQEKTNFKPLEPVEHETLGHADTEKISTLKDEILKSKFPVLLLGMRAGDKRSTTEIRNLLKTINLPVVETFQATGIISRELASNFFGRVGLFKNQPGDKLLDLSDLVITIGYDPIEYDPEIWNSNVLSKKKIFHIDDVMADVDNFYRPNTELIGDIARTIRKLTSLFKKDELLVNSKQKEQLNLIKSEYENMKNEFQTRSKSLIHPLDLIQVFRELVDDDNFNIIDDQTIFTVDVGSIYIWMARYFEVFEPRKLLFSNGMQTLGVALPWAISSWLLNPDKKVISMSGDGGFLYSSAELDTAISLNANITHIIWNDSSYNMVSFQQKIKYNRDTAVDLGTIDFKKYAESFGAKGFEINNINDLKPILIQAIEYDGVSVVNISIDYSSNISLGKMILEHLN